MPIAAPPLPPLLHIPQLLPVLHEPVVKHVVLDDDAAVAPPVVEARAGGVEAVAEAHGVRRDVDGEVLAVALAGAAPDGEEDELCCYEDGEGDEGGGEDRLGVC